MEFSEEVTGIWPGCRCGHALSAATDSLQARGVSGEKIGSAAKELYQAEQVKQNPGLAARIEILETRHEIDSL
jgi:hypothetical protein